MNHADLDRIIADLEANHVPEGLAAAFRKIVEGEDANEALGLKRGPGQRSLATEYRTERRNVLVRMAAATFFPGLSKLQRAKELSKGLGRYHDSAWARRDRNKTECPYKPGRPEAYYWRILKARDRALKWQTIYQLL